MAYLRSKHFLKKKEKSSDVKFHLKRAALLEQSMIAIKKNAHIHCKTTEVC